MVSNQYSELLRAKFDLTGFDLSNFTSDESDFLRNYGNFMESLTLHKIKPITDAQIRFCDFFELKYSFNRNPQAIKSHPFTIQMKVWEKVLLSDEYYKRIKDDPFKLSARNYYVHIYLIFFSIIGAVKELNVYLKVEGHTKIGDDDTVYVKYAFDYIEKNNDKYFQSLIKHDIIGATVYTEKAYDSYMNMGRDFLNSIDGILLQVDCKKIEVEMKISAIKNYSIEKHRISLHLEGYNFEPKYC